MGVPFMSLSFKEVTTLFLREKYGPQKPIVVLSTDGFRTGSASTRSTSVLLHHKVFRQFWYPFLR